MVCSVFTMAGYDFGDGGRCCDIKMPKMDGVEVLQADLHTHTQDQTLHCKILNKI